MLERPTPHEPTPPPGHRPGVQGRPRGRFATGITVVTTLGCGGPARGRDRQLLQLGLSGPAVGPVLSRQGGLELPAFEGAKSFVINVLRDNQQDLSVRFRNRAPRSSATWTSLWETGCPILAGCLANLECRTEAVHPGGDHIIVVGRVVRLALGEAGHPLLYYAGGYQSLEAAALEPFQTLAGVARGGAGAELLGEAPFEIRRRHRLSEEVSLAQGAAVAPQETRLDLGFHALRDGAGAQLAAQSQRAAQDRAHRRPA